MKVCSSHNKQTTVSGQTNIGRIRVKQADSACLSRLCMPKSGVL